MPIRAGLAFSAAESQVTACGKSERVAWPNSQFEVRWPLPEFIEQVLVRAKTDPDPTVRQAAECVGRQAEYGSAFPGGLSGGPPF